MRRLNLARQMCWMALTAQLFQVGYVYGKYSCLEALSKEGISTRVVNMHTIKPLDKK
jgi:deoxyxylulose-5-phosphate synthase